MRIPNKKQYPKHMLIGEHEWEIKFKRVIEKNTTGLCDPSIKTIYLKLGMSHAETFYTFIHELLHAFEDEYDIKVSHKAIYKLEKAIGDLLLANF